MGVLTVLALITLPCVRLILIWCCNPPLLIRLFPNVAKCYITRLYGCDVAVNCGIGDLSRLRATIFFTQQKMLLNSSVVKPGR